MGLMPSPTAIRKATHTDHRDSPPSLKRARLISKAIIESAMSATAVSFRPTAIGGAGIDTTEEDFSAGAASIRGPVVSLTQKKTIVEQRLKHPGTYNITEEMKDEGAKSGWIKEFNSALKPVVLAGKYFIGEPLKLNPTLPRDAITGGFDPFSAKLRSPAVLDRGILPLNPLPTVFDGSYSASATAVSGRKRPHHEISSDSADSAESSRFLTSRDLFGARELLGEEASRREEVMSRRLDQKKRLGEKIEQILDTKKISNARGEEFSLREIRGACGDHSQVYELIGSTQFFQGIDNNRLLVKVYKEDLVRDKRAHLLNYMETSSTQYQELDGKLPITRIYNADTVLEDGFFVVERVTPFEMPWDKTTTVDDLKEHHLGRVKELNSFFNFAKKHTSKIPLDLSKSNFGINSAGLLVLLDFMELADGSFSFIQNNCLESVSMGNPYVREYLDKGSF